VHQPAQRRELIGPGGGAARRHHHLLIPGQQRGDPAEVLELAQLALQLIEYRYCRRHRRNTI